MLKLNNFLGRSYNSCLTLAPVWKRHNLLINRKELQTSIWNLLHIVKCFMKLKECELGVINSLGFL